MKSTDSSLCLPAARALISEESLLPEGCRVLVAVSGGTDSIALLVFLRFLQREGGNFTLSVAHYNHRLRGEESLRDENFVREFTKKMNRAEEGHPSPLPLIPLFVGSGDVKAAAAAEKKGLEETARKLRYTFLLRCARDNGCTRIAAAHNADDNAETLVMHLLRGSALPGLAGMKPRNGCLIRPFLTTSREEITRFADQYSLPHVEDSSNKDDTFLRNQIRHEIMPLLREMGRDTICRIAATQTALRADEARLAEETDAFCAANFEKTDGMIFVNCDVFLPLPPSLFKRSVVQLLRFAGKDFPFDVTGVHIRRITELLQGEDTSKILSLPCGLIAAREYDRLVIAPKERYFLCLTPEKPKRNGETIPKDSLFSCRLRETVCPTPVPKGLWYLSRDALTEDSILRPRREGDRMNLTRGGHRSLKEWMTDEKIPRHLRGRFPVLATGDRVLAVPGLGIDPAFRAAAGSPAYEVQFNKTEGVRKPDVG